MIKNITAYISGLGPAKKNWLAFLVLTGSVGLLYYQTLGFKYCIDDQYYLWLYIEEGSSLRDYITSLRQRFWFESYRPVTFATILIEAVLFDRNPAVHHLFNLGYYALLCYLIYRLTYKFFKKYEERAFYIALLIALLFLLHPSHANVVSSIKNRETILSMGFGLTAMYMWWKFLDVRKLFLIFASVVFLVLGLLAKVDVFPFLLLIPLSGYLYTGKFNFKKNVRYLAVCVGSVLLAYTAIQNWVAAPTDTVFRMAYHENPLIAEDTTLWSRIPYSFYILSIYEKFMVWPKDYLFYFGYDKLEVINTWNTRTIFSLLVHVLIGLACTGLLMKKRLKYLLGPAIFILCIYPFVISIVSGIVAVRYSFIASLGFCIVLAQVLMWLYENIDKRWSRVLVTVLILCIFGVGAFFSRQRSFAWKDLYTLYATDLPKLKQSVNANRMAGLYYYLEAEKMEAGPERTDLLVQSLFHADQALEIYPSISIVYEFKAKALHLLDRKDEAISTYDDLVKLDKTNTKFLNAAAYYAKEVRAYEKSVHYFENIVSQDNSDIAAHIELTQLYIYFGNYQEAIRLNDVLYQNEYTYDALLNFGDIYIASEDTIKAISYYDRAMIIKEEDHIVNEVLRISELMGNDTMVLKMQNFLSD